MYQRKDAFYARAKTAGYRSRAAFKLMELAQRHHLLRRGDTVVELGAWPGGWLQVAAQLVGPSGRVVGVDIVPIEPLPDAAVVTVVGDIELAETMQRVLSACGGQADVLLSDLAPKLTGVRARDQARAAALTECVLMYANEILRSRGMLVAKLFTSPDLAGYVRQLRGRFRQVRTTRPEATRKGSAELYVVGADFRGHGTG
jgi:23S rRNA (uridine2552-2'-O)-methyltransferase